MLEQSKLLKAAAVLLIFLALWLIWPHITTAASCTVWGVNPLNPNGQLDCLSGNPISPPRTFANVPSCTAANEGSIAAVTDATLNTWGSAIAGTGGNHVLGYCDGTSWKIMGQ